MVDSIPMADLIPVVDPIPIEDPITMVNRIPMVESIPMTNHMSMVVSLTLGRQKNPSVPSSLCTEPLPLPPVHRAMSSCLNVGLYFCRS